MSAPIQEAAEIRALVARVIAKDRVSRGLPPVTAEEQATADALAIAKAARRPR